MKLRIYILALLIIFLTSTTSALLLFFYMNIETSMSLAFSAMAIACLLSGGSFFGLCLYTFKRIYYRGEVYLYMINSSLRQGILLSSCIIAWIAFYSLGVLTPKTGALLFGIFVLFELMVQSVSEN